MKVTVRLDIRFFTADYMRRATEAMIAGRPEAQPSPEAVEDLSVGAPA